MLVAVLSYKLNFLQKIDVTVYRRFTPSNSEQRLLPSSYRDCWHEVSRSLFSS